MLYVDILTIKEFLKEHIDKLYSEFSAYEPLLRITTNKAVVIGGDLHGDVNTLLRIIESSRQTVGCT